MASKSVKHYASIIGHYSETSVIGPPLGPSVGPNNDVASVMRLECTSEPSSVPT